MSTPGTADAALSVGAVDKADRLAGFSSRGPRPGDGAIKPDLTAPGVDVVAARSSTGTIGDPVDDHYVSLSGTSMATPHVAGAAGLLASAHPEWTAAQLKAALTGSAAPRPGVSPLAEGAGRVDVARALTETVTSDPVSLGLGTQAWPHGDDPVVVRELTYRNTGGQPVTLNLALATTGPDGRPAPAGMFTVSASKVAVPAGGRAAVTVTVDTTVPGADGWYTGRITATGGNLSVTTPLAIEREVEMHTVTLRHLDRAGKATPDYLVNVSGYDATVHMHPYDPSGTVSFRLPAGHYVLTSWIDEPDGGQSMLVQPWVDLTRADVTVTLDARRAAPVRMSVPHAAAAMMMGVVQFLAGAGSAIEGGMVVDGDFSGVYVANVGPAAPKHRFAATVTAHFAEPGPDGDFADSPYRYNAAFGQYGQMWNGFTRNLRSTDFATVPQRDLQPGIANRALLGISSAPANVPPGDFQWDYPLAFTPNTGHVEYFAGSHVRWWQTYQRFRVEGDALTWAPHEYATWRRIDANTRDMRWGRAVVGPAFPGQDALPPAASRAGDVMSFAVPMFSAGAVGMGGHSPTTAARTALYRDGVKVGDTDEAGGGSFPVPPQTAAYRLETRATRDVSTFSTAV